MAMWEIEDPNGSADRQVATARADLAQMLLVRGLVPTDEPVLALYPDEVVAMVPVRPRLPWDDPHPSAYLADIYPDGWVDNP